MYLERIQGGSELFLQSIVRFPRVSIFEAWWTSYQRRVAAAPALHDIASAYRLCVHEDGSIDRLFRA
jgi:hypothetical protein